MAVDTSEQLIKYPNALGDCFSLAREKIGRRDAERLLGHVFGTSTTQLYSSPKMHVTHDEAQVFFDLVERRRHGEPIEYMTQKCYFWTQKLRVSPAALIPRPETEVLVEAALQLLRDGNRVLDLGTGTGAIALALRSELELQVVASDISVEALELCAENANQLNLAVETLRSDWYSAVGGSFDVIISNPPYVANDDPVLTQSSLRYEPLKALASEKNGLGALETVILGSKPYLVDGGWLLVEHGYNQREEVLGLFNEAGFRNIDCRSDYNDNPRVIFGEKSE
ncbi:MAG: peptide chain release factor N(5)-glutamine methyltransferase [Gammaproteobacteria bacterium]|nr:peptide chain release factor N(5)-glutamine methyltransferase [Gammaproteobacteria bacterium]